MKQKYCVPDSQVPMLPPEMSICVGSYSSHEGLDSLGSAPEWDEVIVD